MGNPVNEITLEDDNSAITAKDYQKIEKLEPEIIGTPFQKKVWNEIKKIPFGKTKSYTDLAEKLDSHPRAIASACAANKLAIYIPCHRVISKTNKLTGFKWRIKLKQKLLLFEGMNIET